MLHKEVMVISQIINRIVINRVFYNTLPRSILTAENEVQKSDMARMKSHIY